MNMVPSFNMTILFISHPDIFEVAIDVDQFKSHVANWIIIRNGLTAIHHQMGYDDVGPDKGITPVKDKSVIREIFVKLIQYKHACRLALIDPQP